MNRRSFLRKITGACAVVAGGGIALLARAAEKERPAYIDAGYEPTLPFDPVKYQGEMEWVNVPEGGVKRSGAFFPMFRWCEQNGYERVR